ncbi:MAG: glycosyltransferase family 4 protein [Candidatus Omnitrophica bacterium]|nr:glycosyltransferase family 4 protein [Candidatus Omnitrophota bacterium]
MRIAMFHWGFPPIIGGVETHLTMLCPTLVQKGHKVALLTSTVESINKIEDSYKGMSIRRTPLMDLNWLHKRGLEDIEDKVEEVFAEFIEKTRPDIIHAHNMHYFSPAHTKILEKMAKKKGIPLVLTAHNVWDDILFLDLTLDIAWDHIISVSEFIAKELASAGVSRKKVTVVHHGIDTKKFAPQRAKKEIFKRYPKLKHKRVLFHPARSGLAKGSDIGVKALRIIKKAIPDVLLILAGTRRIIDWSDSQHKDLAYIVQLIKRFGLEDNTFMNVFSHDEIPDLYHASEFAIYPSSVGEPFGLTMLEAMACAKPMIVTNSGGMPEIIKNGVNGFVIKVRDYKALADRCITLFKDPERKSNLGQTAREITEQKFTKEIMTENTLAVYRKLAKKQKR